MRAAVATLLVALPLAGCLDPPPADPLVPVAPEVFDWLAPLALDHDHGDLSLHGLATPNLRLLGHLPLPGLAGAYPTPGWGELDIHEDLALVAALNSGFFAVDIADPAAMTVLSITPLEPGAYAADVKASHDGRYAFVGLQGTSPGIRVYDLADPARPLPAAHWPVKATGCHMLSYRAIGDGEYLFCSSGPIHILRFTRTPIPALREVAVYHGTGAADVVGLGTSGGMGLGSHDMTVQDDPVTGTPVMFGSLWDEGVWVADVSDPAAPRDLGSWAGEGAENWDGKVHTAMATMIGDRRVVLAVPEYAAVPTLYVLDAADYGRMRVLDAWIPRGTADYGDHVMRFSMHNFQVVGTRVYLAMYHGGVWVLDLDGAGKVQPRGYYLPHEAPTRALSGDSPSTWDVVVADGRAFAVDMASGLYALEFDGDPAGDPGHDSFG